MKYRNFGKENIQVSEVGLGTWQISPDWDEGMDEGRALEIMEAAVSTGINFFDTADVYGGGQSEKAIGKFIKNHTDIFVATKIGRRSDPGWPENFSFETMGRHIDDSLRRLGVDCLDLVQLHCIPTEEMRRGEVFKHLKKFKKLGKIRRFGASVESMEEALICLEQEGLSSLQIIFNIFRQKAIDELFDKAKARGVAIIARVPLASGLLSGKFTQSMKFNANDHRNYNRDGEKFNVGETFAGLPFEKGVELADELKLLVSEGLTLAQMALRFILDQEAIATVIPGASRPEQVELNAKASDLSPLGQELHDQLRDFYIEKVRDNIRGPY